eukprot:214561_1
MAYLIPPFDEVVYCGYFIIVIYGILYGLKELIKYCTKKRRKGTKSNLIDQNKNVDYTKMAMDNLSTDDTVKPHNTEEKITVDIDESIRKLNTSKSIFSIVLELSDIVNSILWIIYFEYFCGYSITSEIGIVQISFFGLKNLIHLVYFINYFCLKYNKQYQTYDLFKHKKIIYDYFRYIFFGINIIFKVYYSYNKLHQITTFYSLTLSLALNIKNLLMLPFEYITKFVDIILKSIQDQSNVPNKNKQSWKTKIKKKIENGLVQIIILIPIFVSINIITFSMLLLGESWIIFYGIIWYILPLIPMIFAQNINENMTKWLSIFLSIQLLIGFGCYYTNLYVGTAQFIKEIEGTQQKNNNYILFGIPSLIFYLFQGMTGLILMLYSVCYFNINGCKSGLFYVFILCNYILIFIAPPIIAGFTDWTLVAIIFASYPVCLVGLCMIIFVGIVCCNCQRCLERTDDQGTMILNCFIFPFFGLILQICILVGMVETVGLISGSNTGELIGFFYFYISCVVIFVIVLICLYKTNKRK